MKIQSIALLTLLCAFAGCQMPTKPAHRTVQPEWNEIKGLTKSEIVVLLREKGDSTIALIDRNRALLSERRVLLASKGGDEANAEIQKIDGIIGALAEQAGREAEMRYNAAFTNAVMGDRK